MACITGVVGWSAWDARQAAFGRAAQNAQNLTAALAHDVERNLESYDLSLQNANGQRLQLEMEPGAATEILLTLCRSGWSASP